ncbi:MAG: cob(I)yrinic acid a,c-diamide adenosyltransferase [Deltaproteobacteria bacterium]|nr:cob(I)yrinic acid a,c-diamide adenosyltransferase [Deltaproteobacteria bacterium]
MKRCLLMVYTGNGKGKTTAAIGQAVRAMGQGMKVCFIQFLKGSWKYGELTAAERFSDLMEFHVLGRGFTWKSEDLEKDIAVARAAWELAKEKILSAEFQMVVLDELTYLIQYNMVEEAEIVGFLSARPANLHVVVTGRDASEALIQAADLVTEMREIKHPYSAGVKAQKGIEF